MKENITNDVETFNFIIRCIMQIENKLETKIEKIKEIKYFYLDRSKYIVVCKQIWRSSSSNRIDLFSRFIMKLDTVTIIWFSKWIWHNGRGWRAVKVQFMGWYFDRIFEKLIIKHCELQKILKHVALGRIRKFEVLL